MAHLRRYHPDMANLGWRDAFHEGAAALTTMTASGCLPCDTLANDTPVTLASSEVSPDTFGSVVATPLSPRWAGVIGVEGEVTGDGRLIEPNALQWDTPFPLRYVDEDSGAHDGAVVVGTVQTVERRPGGILWGTGLFDVADTTALKAQRQVADNFVNGVSMDLDDVSFEIRIAADLLEDDGPLGMLMLAAETPTGHKMGPDGKMVECDPMSDEDCEADEPEEPELEVDADGRVVVMQMKSDDELRVTTSGRIRAATIVAIPAFASAMIHLDEDVSMAASAVVAEAERLVAAAAPPAPPVHWFNRPRFSGPTPMTIGKDGRVQGHIALWDTCHTSHTAPGQCIKPPRSSTGYAYFLTGAMLTAEGAEIPVGRITLNTLHADEHLSAAATIAHYEKTGTAAAYVNVGDDEWGIWVAGTVEPELSDREIREFRAAPISGDWRRLGGTLELVAALAVNVAGFPIPRPKGLVASGEIMSLVASGMLAPKGGVRPMAGLSLDDLRYLKRLAARERHAESVAAAEEVVDPRALHVHAFALRRRVHPDRGGQ